MTVQDLLEVLGIKEADLEVLCWKLQEALAQWRREKTQRDQETEIARVERQAMEELRRARAAVERVAAGHPDLARHPLSAYREHPEVQTALRESGYEAAIETAYRLAKAKP